MKLGAVLGVVLFTVWLLWSGHFVPLLVTLGLFSTGLVVTLAWRMRIVDDEGVPLRLPLRAVTFLPWIFWEILKANVDVTLRILNPRLPIRPTLIRVRTGQSSDLGRMIYANCITLTPGTVSVDVEGDLITVHALSREAAQGLLSGEMNRKVTHFEGLR